MSILKCWLSPVKAEVQINDILDAVLTDLYFLLGDHFNTKTN